MLAIRVNEEYLDLNQDVVISIKFMSPLFNTLGDYSFPFKLPFTSKNKMILRFIHRVENTNDKYQFFPADVLWAGVGMLSGSMRIKTAADYYEAVLYIDKGNFNFQSSKQTLHEMNLGKIVQTSETAAMEYYNDSLTKVYPEVNVAFPLVANDLFYGTVATDEQKAFYNFYFSSVPTGLRDVTDHGDPTILVPFVYLRFLLNKAVSLLNYSLDDQFFGQSEELANLLIYNSRNIDNDQLFGGMYPGTIFYQQHMPRVSLNAFIHGLEKYLNCYFFVDDINKIVTIKGAQDILHSSVVIPFTEGVTNLAVLIADQITGAQLAMKPDDGDPAFSDQIQWETGNTIEWTGTVQTMGDLFIPPYSNIVTAGDVWYVIDVNKYYKASLGSGQVITWAELTQDITASTTFNYRYMSELITKIETDLSCLYQFTSWEYPSCENKKDDWKKISSRLIFVTMVDGRIRSATSNENLSLFFHGPKGLFKKFFQEWINWQLDMAVNVQFSKQLSFIDIRDLDFTAKHEIHGNNYLLSEVAVTLTKNTIKPSLIKAFSCL